MEEAEVGVGSGVSVRLRMGCKTRMQDIDEGSGEAWGL